MSCFGPPSGSILKKPRSEKQLGKKRSVTFESGTDNTEYQKPMQRTSHNRNLANFHREPTKKDWDWLLQGGLEAEELAEAQHDMADRRVAPYTRSTVQRK
jgi:hypothetical protein